MARWPDRVAPASPSGPAGHCPFSSVDLGPWLLRGNGHGASSLLERHLSSTRPGVCPAPARAARGQAWAGRCLCLWGDFRLTPGNLWKVGPRRPSHVTWTLHSLDGLQCHRGQVSQKHVSPGSPGVSVAWSPTGCPEEGGPLLSSPLAAGHRAEPLLVTAATSTSPTTEPSGLCPSP